MLIKRENLPNIFHINKIYNLDPILVKPVNMGRYGVSTESEPVLFTIGLGSCKCLVASVDNFAFMSHIDMGDCFNQWEVEFYKSGRGQYSDVRTKECIVPRQMYVELYRYLMSHKECSGPIKVQLINGIDDSIPLIDRATVLNNNIENTINMLKSKFGIEVVRLPDVTGDTVVLDSRTGDILKDEQTSNSEEFVKPTDIPKYK